MFSVHFKVQFFPNDSGDHWRVFGQDGHYCSAATIDDIPTAVRHMLDKEADDLKRLGEAKN